MITQSLETASYLFSILAFSFSSHALIKAHLFSASTFASRASERVMPTNYFSKIHVNFKQFEIVSHAYLCQLNSLNLFHLQYLSSLSHWRIKESDKIFCNMLIKKSSIIEWCSPRIQNCLNSKNFLVSYP